jgi:hypothetical protein
LNRPRTGTSAGVERTDAPALFSVVVRPDGLQNGQLDLRNARREPPLDIAHLG